MDADQDRSASPTASRSREHTPNDNEDDIANSSSPNTDHDFDESQCLFCNQMSADLDQNQAHMLKAHGLYVDPTNLLVDVESLLAYFHLVISGYHECLYCGTQRNTHQAVQQHMMAKGHCKYDITDKDSELRDFYDFSSADAEERLRQNHPAIRFSDDPQVLLQAKSRRTRPLKREDRHDPITASPLDQGLPTPTPDSQTEAETSSQSPGELITKAMRQAYTLNNQLSQLRADDRRSLLHLPASQQRGLLATRHKQMEKARRTEQTQRGNLETAANHSGRLSTIRLIRKPPHTGNVGSLNR